MIVLLPNFNLLAATVSAAEPLPDAPASATLPNDVDPSVNATVPPGAALPLAALTVAVSVVEALCAIDAGFALALMLVETVPPVTVTVACPLDGAHLESPA